MLGQRSAKRGCVRVLVLASFMVACGQPDAHDTLAGSETGETSNETGDETSDETGDETSVVCDAPVELPANPPAPLTWTFVGELDINDQGLSSAIGS